jgi:2-dehydropantoate 2-reductase
MKIAIVGIGALGCLLGAYLGDAGDVIMIGHWPEQVRTIRQYGLGLEYPTGRRTFHRPAITDNPADVGPVDVALVVVKSRQTADAARTVAEILKPDGLAITLQNGLNNCATLREVLGESRVTLGVTSEGATVLGVAEVRHAGRGPTHFGRDAMLGRPQLALLPGVVDLFNRAGFEAHLVDDTDGLVWGKLAVNAAINPLTALLRVPNGFLIEHEALIDIMTRAAREVAAVADAQRILLPFPDAAERALEVAQATAANRSSMLQDVMRGAPTEVEAICGAVARIARELGVYTPINVRLCRLVRQVEAGNPPLLEKGDVAGLLRLLDLESIK